MTQPGIESLFPGSLANTLLIRPMVLYIYIYIYIYIYVCVCVCAYTNTLGDYTLLGPQQRNKRSSTYLLQVKDIYKLSNKAISKMSSPQKKGHTWRNRKTIIFLYYEFNFLSASVNEVSSILTVSDSDKSEIIKMTAFFPLELFLLHPSWCSDKGHVRNHLFAASTT